MTEEKSLGSRRVLSPQERRQRNREEMIQGILDVAREVMREDGVAALNLNEVARRIGMRTPSLYTYFPNKMAIYDALFMRGIRAYRESAEATIAQYGGTWESVRQAMFHYMAFAHENPELFQLLFERPVPSFVPSEQSMAEAAKLIQVSAQAMQALIDNGYARADLPVEQANDMLVAVMHGLTAMQQANEPHLPPGEGRFGGLIDAAMAMLRAAWSANPNDAQ
jgi:AcrR family transcriptional regulator